MADLPGMQQKQGLQMLAPENPIGSSWQQEAPRGQSLAVGHPSNSIEHRLTGFVTGPPS